MWILMEQAAAQRAQKTQQEVVKEEGEADEVRESVESGAQPEVAIMLQLIGHVNTVRLWTQNLVAHARCAINNTNEKKPLVFQPK